MTAAPAEFTQVGLPATVRAGETLSGSLRWRNTGKALAEAFGPNRSVLTAMIVDGNGNPWPSAPATARLAYPVPPGGSTTMDLALTAPTVPGRYVLLCGIARVEKGTLVLGAAPPLQLPFTVEPAN